MKPWQEKEIKNAIAFPRAKVNDSKMDFSFSGLKSSVLNYLNKCEMKGEEVNRADVAASFQEAVVDVLSSHGVEAAKELRIQETCNRRWSCIQWSISCKNDRDDVRKQELNFIIHLLSFCTDNAAMIGVCGYYDYINGVRSGLDLNAVPGLKIGTRQG